MTYKELENTLINSVNDIYGHREAKSIQRFLFQHYTGKEPAGYLLIRHENASIQFENCIYEAIGKLRKFIPVQYITGVSWFCGLEFKVKPGVLIPRPETEELVLKVVDLHKSKSNLRILDIGTGSGVIAISLAKLIKNSDVSAIDISTIALEVAEENADSIGADVRFTQIDIFERNRWKDFGLYNLIISNPPYVRQSEKVFMNRNVLDHEPELALFVQDSDPLLYYRVIAAFAKEHLTYEGELWFEINETENHNIMFMLKEQWFDSIKFYNDFNSKPRYVRCCMLSDVKR